MSDEGFLAEIAATPDDAAPYLVYADALQLRGDPRGELIMLQHALETAAPQVAADLKRREAELIEQNAERWLGGLREFSLEVRWRFGFLNAARVCDETDADAVRALLATETVPSTLAELRLGMSVNDYDDWEDWESVQSLVDALRWHPALRRLYINDLDLRGMHLAPRVRIPEQAKQLDTLVVQSSEINLAWDASPAKLRSLELRSPNLDAHALVAIRAWPNLESLTVWIEDATRILPMLSRKKLPKLKHLGLCGTASTSIVATELARNEITKQLASLSLVGGTLATTKALQAFADRVKIDARWNVLGKPERAQLGAFGAQVSQQRGGKAALTDRDELGRLLERITDAAGDVQGTAKGLAKIIASTPDPYWLHDARIEAADDLDAHAKRDALIAVMRDCEAQLVPLTSQDNSDIYYAIGEISDALVEGHEAEVWLWNAVADARWNDRPADEMRALGLIGTTRMRRGDPVHAATILDRVLAYFLERGSTGEQAWALRQRGNVDLVRSHYGTAEGFYRRALELYREAKDKNNEGIVLSELAGVLWSRQDFEGAVAMIKQSITMRPEGSLGLASCYYNLGAVLNGMGRIAESREAGKMSLAIFRKHQRKDGEGQALSLLGELAQRSNEHAEAQAMLEQALALHRERGAIRETGITLGNLARVALDRAQFDEARRLAEEAVELHRECGNKYNEGMQLLDCTDAAIGEHRLDDAQVIVEEAMVPLLAIENFPALAAAKCRRGFIAQLRGDFAAADAHYDEAIAEAKRGNYQEQVGWTQLYRAVIRAKQQRASEARALVEEARPYLKDSAQGMETLAMTEAVIERRALPAPLNFDARLIAMLGA